MKKLLIATHNLAKVSDYTEILNNHPFTIITLNDLNITQQADEPGENFQDNSLYKAKFYGNLSGYLTLADDGGLEIPILNNYPGVRTRRWESENPLNDEELIDKILKKLKKYNGKDRKAILKTVVTIYNPDNGKYLQAIGSIEGEITKQPSAIKQPGYPIRSIFFVTKAGKYLSDFNKKEKTLYNHRLVAVKQIIKEINSL